MQNCTYLTFSSISTKMTYETQKIHEMTCGQKNFTGLTLLCNAIHQGGTSNCVTPQIMALQKRKCGAVAGGVAP